MRFSDEGFVNVVCMFSNVKILFFISMQINPDSWTVLLELHKLHLPVFEAYSKSTTKIQLKHTTTLAFYIHDAKLLFQLLNNYFKLQHLLFSL